MSNELAGKKIAILATMGFEQAELEKPKKALEDAGAAAHVVSPAKGGAIKGWEKDDWGREVKIDVAIADANPADYDALVLPGGVINPDKLRIDEPSMTFIRAFVQARKPIGAICHGPWTLIDAGAVKGRRVTSWKSIRTDLENAGATWVDEQVVRDGNLVTSRKPDDLPAFNAKLVEVFAGRGR